MKKLLLCLVLILLIGCQATREDMLKLNLREHKELALHIHPILQIEIVGNNLTIPAEVGISDLGMRVIHTHDTTGKLHAEAPSPFQFHLDDFFEIWGKNLNSTCIFDLCENEKFSLKIYVNGVEVNKSERIPLFDKDLIKIVYS